MCVLYVFVCFCVYVLCVCVSMCSALVRMPVYVFSGCLRVSVCLVCMSVVSVSFFFLCVYVCVYLGGQGKRNWPGEVSSCFTVLCCQLTLFVHTTLSI